MQAERRLLRATGQIATAQQEADWKQSKRQVASAQFVQLTHAHLVYKLHDGGFSATLSESMNDSCNSAQVLVQRLAGLLRGLDFTCHCNDAMGVQGASMLPDCIVRRRARRGLCTALPSTASWALLRQGSTSLGL